VKHSPRRLPFLAALLCLATPLVAAAADSGGTPQRLASALRQRGLRGAEVGALVVRARDGVEVFAHNPDRALIPASNAKILTAVAALQLFGPSHHFTTSVLADAAPASDGSVQTLAVRGGGDPGLTSEQLWRLAADLQRRGLRRVRGDLILDDTHFDEQYHHPLWGGVSARAFHAGVAALSANYGAFTVEVTPTTPGASPRVQVDPPVPYFRVVNRAVTRGRGARGKALAVERRANGDGDDLIVTGTIQQGAEPMSIYRSASHPVLYAGAVLRMQLAAAGIEIGGALRRARTPDDFVELLAFEGQPLSEIVRLYMKFSNNNIAETLLKDIGARQFGPPGTWENGAAAARDILADLGIDPSGFNLVDGSGLSRSDRVTPRTLVRALQVGRASFRAGPELVASLPIAARDGTLRRRAAGAAESVRAKTGLLSGATALSGFARSHNGDELVFSIIANDYKAGDTEAMHALDEFVAALVE
jgi:D-alanyl-D-alanine carboxypeptidase/D-alanyl-D-alanine-endopeptidase (penicillin-binding protein 4)